jgi:hypothetical protein
MMQIVENWAWLTCRLESARAAGDHLEIDAVLESADDIADARNLFATLVGQHIAIRLRGDRLPPASGSRFALKARLAGSGTAWGDSASFRLLGS